MVPMNFAKLTLFFVVLTSFATSQPFSRSHGATKRTGFEWNARKIGTKKVATISIRKDEERDRRSVPLADVVSSIRKTHPGLSPEPLLAGERRRHHHRHHHGDDVEDVEYLTDGGEGEEEGTSEDDSSSSDEMDLRDVQLSELRLAGSIDTSRLPDILASSGLDVDAEVFKNVTATADRRKRRKNGNKKSGKKRSKKVKRARRKKKNRKKNRKSRERRRQLRKCKQFKGRQKKKCRAAVLAAAESDINMSGSEACQFHNLEECCRKVGFLSLAPESLLPVDKCRYREEFFDCMEEQRREDCPSNFEVKGDMKALRTKIRDVIWTTNSCLISEVIEG